MKGFRQRPEQNRKERLKGLESRLANLEMASRISQMMTQQLLQGTRNMQEDLGRALGLLNETQYKLLAVQEAAGLDVKQLNEIANVKRLKDFNEASDREDAKGGFTVGSVVEANSTVILTSKTEEEDRGIFRSRIELSKCGVPDLINAFMGREVGAKAIVKLNDIEHEVELLGIRTPPAESSDKSTSGTDGQELATGSEAVSDEPASAALQTEGTQTVGA